MIISKARPDLGSEALSIVKNLPPPLKWSVPIDILPLTFRTWNALYNGHRIHTLGQLFELTEQELRNMRWIGPKTRHEIKEALYTVNCSLKCSL